LHDHESLRDNRKLFGSGTGCRLENVMDRDKLVQADLRRRQEALKEHTRREVRAAHEQRRHTEAILAEYKRLEMEPRYCGTDLISPWLIAAKKR
jgi:hypothetical protein